MAVDPDPLAGLDRVLDPTRDEPALAPDAIDPFVAGMAVPTEPGTV